MAGCQRLKGPAKSPGLEAGLRRLARSGAFPGGLSRLREKKKKQEERSKKHTSCFLLPQKASYQKRAVDFSSFPGFRFGCSFGYCLQEAPRIGVALVSVAWLVSWCPCFSCFPWNRETTVASFPEADHFGAEAAVCMANDGWMANCGRSPARCGLVWTK